MIAGLVVSLFLVLFLCVALGAQAQEVGLFLRPILVK